MDQTSSEQKKHSGGCHCGKVRYEVTMALNGAIACNCSICGKKGTLLSFAPSSQFQLLQGENALTDYQWGKKNIHHLFCSTCGVTSFARGAMPDGTPMIAINVRCLDDVDLASIPVKLHDGRSQ